MRRSVAFRIVACVLLGTMSACHTWRPYTGAGSHPDPELPTTVRFNLDSGSSIELTGARLVGDSAYVGEESPGSVTWIPASSVVSMEQEEFAAGRTGLVILGAVAIVVGLSVAVYASEDGGVWTPPN